MIESMKLTVLGMLLLASLPAHEPTHPYPSQEGTGQSSPPGRGRGGFRVALRARSPGWSLHSVVMVPLSIADLTGRAELVVQATVLSKACQRDPAGRIYTTVELQVAETWKGTWKTNRLTVVHGGGILGEERVEVSGQVDYQIGEQVVAFIVFNQRNEAVTLGLAQGKFHLWKDTASGALLARNPFHGSREAETAIEPSTGGREESRASGASRLLTLAKLKATVKGETK